MPMFEVKFLKNGSTFFNYTSFILEENLSFHINLVSQLDAIVGEAGIPRNIDERKHPYMAIYGHQLTCHAYVSSQISQKRLEIF